MFDGIWCDIWGAQDSWAQDSSQSPRHNVARASKWTSQNGPNLLVDVYKIMSSSFSSSFCIIRESFYSSSPLIEIVDVIGFHHCLQYLPYTMMDASTYISFYSSKYESREDYQENEALQSTLMVMSGPHSFGLSSRINKFISINILSPRTPHTYSTHGPHLVCYFLLNSLDQFYDSNAIFYDRIEAWLEISYLDTFPMNNHYDILSMVTKVFDVLIFPIFSLLLFQVLLLIFCHEHMFACLGLHGWLHWHYDFT